ncbi:MAG: Lead, cadmium, zinc and mercury transporting ATPase [Candidatus Ozemobacter sibiricus]|jgi:Ca2+-transporting ATPase|uniref:Lead, cadmium, zinc and mercury transporting ATPase n=1 Tax=Candidatus Ozemobacter sibiricus TaxID=2268124 RepID=A0A367ZVG9_9BACT|nr:MAG: Lead, cadmium, zinc and mercury transporting ATPase [Candidatus Ozemobacter sibiricus]
MDHLRQAIAQDWSIQDGEAALRAFGSSTAGLTRSEAEARAQVFGPNEIAQGKPTPWYVLLKRQFESPLIFILLLAAAATWLVSEHPSDAWIILAVLAINAAIGYYQERKAERAINNIKGMSAPRCRVRREGQVIDLDARQLVPGDIILLEEGDRVPADGRLLSAVRLRVEEAIFTGETVAAAKQIAPLAAPSVLADRTDMVFMGTHVTSGRGEAVVTAIGMATELGKIAGLVQTAEDVQTPLQKKLDGFSAFIARAVLGICLLIFVSSYVVWRQPFGEVLLNAIALAVSAIPEGLPVVITLVLAIGVRRMAAHQALIRKLPTVETLGSATVICTDKTGTLTRNEMVVVKVFTGDAEYTVTGEGYACVGQILQADGKPAPAAALAPLLETAVLCNNSSLKLEADGTWQMVGDGTEGALLTLAGKSAAALLTLRHQQQRLAELPFDSKIKFMITVHATPDGRPRAHLKGSLEAVLARCAAYLTAAGPQPLTPAIIDRIKRINLAYADEALRVLGFACRDLPADFDPATFPDQDHQGYTFLGLVGMMDLPRPEAVAAVTRCRRAGIKVVMITGDHPATARAVGRKVGIFDEGMRMMTGAELQQLDDAGLRAIVQEVAIYARTSPEDKMRIIQALQWHGHVVSMTGDGVNDAPALTRADIGVAMGRSGTDVAREAAGMVLVDDNFASIVAAVEEGRIIYNNLRKALGFLMATNAGEVITLLAASLLGLAAPLRAVMILWVNLVTDGFTTIALGVDPPEGDEMDRPPRSPREDLLSGPMKMQLAIVAPLMAVGTLLAYRLGLSQALAAGSDAAGAARVAQTMAFGTMVFFQLFNIFNCRSYEKSLFRIGLASNPTLLGAVGLAALLQIGAMYLPFMQTLLGTVSLSASQLAIVLGLSLTVVPAVELGKLVRR